MMWPGSEDAGDSLQNQSAALRVAFAPWLSAAIPLVRPSPSPPPPLIIAPLGSTPSPSPSPLALECPTPLCSSPPPSSLPPLGSPSAPRVFTPSGSAIRCDSPTPPSPRPVSPSSVFSTAGFGGPPALVAAADLCDPEVLAFVLSVDLAWTLPPVPGLRCRGNQHTVPVVTVHHGLEDRARAWRRLFDNPRRRTALSRDGGQQIIWIAPRPAAVAPPPAPAPFLPAPRAHVFSPEDCRRRHRTMLRARRRRRAVESAFATSLGVPPTNQLDEPLRCLVVTVPARSLPSFRRCRRRLRRTRISRICPTGYFAS